MTATVSLYRSNIPKSVIFLRFALPGATHDNSDMPRKSMQQDDSAATEPIGPTREWMAAADSATYLGLGLSAFYRHAVHDPSLPRVRIGIRVLFRRRDLDGWMERHMVRGKDPRLVLSHRGRGRRAPSSWRVRS